MTAAEVLRRREEWRRQTERGDLAGLDDLIIHAGESELDALRRELRETRTDYANAARGREAARRDLDKARAIIAQHDLCHDQHGKVDARAFADGCAREQRKLYGCAPDVDALAGCYTMLEHMRGVLNMLLNDSRLVSKPPRESEL